MIHLKTFSTAVFSFVAMAAIAQQASADVYAHLDRVALDIVRQTSLLGHEAAHYRHTPEYPHLVHDLRQIQAFANHIHEVAHYRGSIAHLDRDLRQLDAQFHHLEDVVRRIQRNARHGVGHVHGRTGHVRRLMRALENNIHHMQADVVSLRRQFQYQNQTYFYGGNQGVVFYYGSNRGNVYRNYGYGNYGHGNYGHGQHRHGNRGHRGNDRHCENNHGQHGHRGNNGQNQRQRSNPVIGKQRNANQSAARFGKR